MIGGAISVLRAVSYLPVWLRAFLILSAALWVLSIGMAVFVARERADAADDARREFDAKQSQEVKDAIIRAAPGPRPSGGEFLECLRRGGPGCL